MDTLSRKRLKITTLVDYCLTLASPISSSHSSATNTSDAAAEDNSASENAPQRDHHGPLEMPVLAPVQFVLRGRVGLVGARLAWVTRNESSQWNNPADATDADKARNATVKGVHCLVSQAECSEDGHGVNRDSEDGEHSKLRWDVFVRYIQTHYCCAILRGPGTVQLVGAALQVRIIIPRVFGYELVDVESQNNCSWSNATKHRSELGLGIVHLRVHFFLRHRHCCLIFQK